jgi:hypothetical protein
MRIVAVDIRTRIALSRLLEKMEKHPEFCSEIGLTGTVAVSSKDVNEKKEVREKC